MPDEPEVRAAGGLIVRPVDGNAEDGIEVAVVHRPRYRDWSFPKGKLERGESWEQAALREVREETGLQCELGEELPRVEYVDRKGRSKSVRYWRMSVTAGRFAANDEVDDLRWLAPDAARKILSYERDCELLDEL
jgi:8-oxo-dGTP diphosphatase